MNQMSVMLKALSDPTRLKIIDLLLDYNYCVGAVAKRLEITESAVSQHLKILRDAGLVVGKKYGYFVHYEVDTSAMHALADQIHEMVEGRARQNCDMVTDECKCHRVFDRFSVAVGDRYGA